MKKLNQKNFLDVNLNKKQNNKLNKLSWVLIGHTCEFKKIRDFKTLLLFDKPIIIYNFKEGLKAFTNICSHRGNIIKNDIKGNGAFVCPYHSWSYDKNGLPKSIPLNDKCFKFSKKDIKNLKLESWKIDYCGKFIFISNNQNSVSLKSFLGSKNFEDLSIKSKLIKSHAASFNWKWKANWKICVENSIDEYHAIFLHQTSFKKTLSLTPKYVIDRNVMSMETDMSDDYKKSAENFKKLFKIDSKGKYEHTLIFPFSTLANSMHQSFYIQNYIPLSVDETLITSDMYLAECNTEFESVKGAYIESAKKFNNTVFNEDKVVCENIQIGLSKKEIFEVIGNFEKRIISFREKIKGISV